MNFFEQRRRHRYIDRSIEASRTALQMPDVAGELGSLAIHCLDVVDNLFVPNIRGGQVIIPPNIKDTELVPVIALQPGESFILPRELKKPTPRQYQSAAYHINESVQHAIADASPEELAAGIRYYQAEFERFLPDEWVFPGFSNQLGQVLTYEITMDVDLRALNGQKSRRYWTARPLIALNCGRRFVRGHAPASLLPHEAVHVHQEQNKVFTVCESTDVAESELEAYHVSAVIARAQLKEAGRLYGSMDQKERVVGGVGIFSMEIDKLRLSGAAVDDFTARPDLTALMLRHGAIDSDPFA